METQLSLQKWAKSQSFGRMMASYAGRMTEKAIYVRPDVGIREVCERPPGNPEGKGGGKRGKIGGWSAESRKRFQRLIWEYWFPADWITLSATFTVPVVLDIETKRRLWHDWQGRARRAGWAAIWRLEVQQRGAVHWHVLIGMAPSSPLKLTPETRIQLGGLNAEQSWFASLNSLGCVDWQGKGRYVPEVGRMVFGGSLSEYPGANKKAVDVKAIDSEAGAYRYLLEHATKRKQAQIAHGLGRHWGVINRAALVRRPEPGKLTIPGELKPFWDRWWPKMARPRIHQRVKGPDGKLVRWCFKYHRPGLKRKCMVCVWCTRKGYSRSAIRIGSQVWFGPHQAMAAARLLEWVKAEYGGR